MPLDDKAKEDAKRNLSLIFDNVCSVLGIEQAELFAMVNEVITGEIVKDADILH